MVYGVTRGEDVGPANSGLTESWTHAGTYMGTPKAPQHPYSYSCIRVSTSHMSSSSPLLEREMKSLLRLGWPPP